MSRKTIAAGVLGAGLVLSGLVVTTGNAWADDDGTRLTIVQTESSAESRADCPYSGIEDDGTDSPSVAPSNAAAL